MAAFANCEVFAKFVTLCQQFLDDGGPQKGTIMDWLISQNGEEAVPIPEAFIRAFED
jgi:hypothetical protein